MTDNRDLGFDPSYRELSAQSAYIPVMEPNGLPDPVIMADLTSLPDKFLPLFRSRLFNDTKFDASSFSVVKTSEFPLITDHRVLESLFSKVSFYEPKGQSSDYMPYAKPPTAAHAVGSASASSASSAPAAAAAPAQEAMQRSKPLPPTHSFAPAQRLPDGWVEKTEKSTGKTYYSNSTLKKTSWDRPT